MAADERMKLRLDIESVIMVTNLPLESFDFYRLQPSRYGGLMSWLASSTY